MVQKIRVELVKAKANPADWRSGPQNPGGRNGKPGSLEGRIFGIG